MLASNVFQSGRFRIFLRQNGLRNRPFDADGRVVPAQCLLGLAMIELRALIGEQ